MNRVIRVVVVDDHLVVREGLRLILESSDDFELIGDAGDGASALHLLGQTQPDVVLMDLRMPGMDGLETIARIRRGWPQIAIVILTTYDDDDLMLRGLQSGASGYLLKDTDRETLFHALRTAARGETLLPAEKMARLLARLRNRVEPEQAAEEVQQITERERAILTLVARGERNKEIAAKLNISEPTVKTHLSRIYYKLGVDSRSSAVAVAMERGLISTLSQKNQGMQNDLMDNPHRQ
jgi:NarL family two-component system response regulator YdfI